jgi:signal transduction histidine kinase
VTVATGRRAWRAIAVQPLLDVGVPALLGALTVAQLVADEPAGNTALITALALASVLPLVARRRAPLAVTAVVAAGVVGQTLATPDFAPATFASFVATMICVYTLARLGSPRVAVAGLVLVAVAVTVSAVLQARTVPMQPFEVVYPLVYFGLAAGLGALVRQRSLRLSAVEDRAAALEGQLAREAELAAAQERTRIARELHDVVAHGLSMMVVQAEAAEEMLAHDPAAAEKPIRRIQDTGRQSLAEMRRLLGVLRAAGVDAATTAPQPSLQRLPDLMREASGGGLAVDVEVTGTPVELPLGVELTAYRLVQEALTNTRRHAGAAHARVRLTYADGALLVEVTDDGRGPAGGRPGHGLIGMRERTALYGGTLETGPGPDGGFRVAAVLPTGEPA